MNYQGLIVQRACWFWLQLLPLSSGSYSTVRASSFGVCGWQDNHVHAYMLKGSISNLYLYVTALGSLALSVVTIFRSSSSISIQSSILYMHRFNLIALNWSCRLIENPFHKLLRFLSDSKKWIIRYNSDLGYNRITSIRASYYTMWMLQVL